MNAPSPPFRIIETERPSETGRTPVDAARRDLDRALENLQREAIEWHGSDPETRNEPFQAGIGITTGAGKSHYLREMAARLIADAKQRGLPHRVLFLIPTHALGHEARQRLPAGVTSHLWQSRKATSVTTGKPMCLNLDAVKATERLSLNVEDTVCKRGRDENVVRCAFYERCEFQAQKASAKTADVVFAAHQIGLKMPGAIGQGFGLVIIDEAFWQAGLSTTTRLSIHGLADELDAFPVVGHDRKKLDVETQHLDELLGRLISALADLPDGYVPRQALLDAGLQPSTLIDPCSAATARKLEWQRKVDPKLTPASSGEAFADAAKKFGFLGQLPTRVSMWHCVEELLEGDEGVSGRLYLKPHTTKEGSFRYLRLLRRSDLDDKVLALPIIHADATLTAETVRPFLPRFELRLDVDVAAPHETITQVVGLPVGKASLRALPGGKRREGEEGRVGRKRQRLVKVVKRLSRGKKTLVITHKDIEAEFANIDGVQVAHWGAFEGIDIWRDVDVIITIGRPLPHPTEVQAMAAALTGKPVATPEMEKYDATIRLKTGATVSLASWRYSDPAAELIRQAVAEVSLVQAIGRGRGVNRTPDDPVEVYCICGDVALPMQVDAVVGFKGLEPTRIDKMFEAGIVPTPSDAAKLYPELFISRNAAVQLYKHQEFSLDRYEQSLLGSRPYKNIYIRDRPQYRAVFKPLKGRGVARSSRQCLVDKSRIDKVRVVLEAALGPLETFVLIKIDAPEPLDRAGNSDNVPIKPPRKLSQPGMFGAAVVKISPLQLRPPSPRIWRNGCSAS